MKMPNIQKKSNRILKFDVALALTSAFLLGVLLLNTSPNRVGPLGITGIFVLLLVLLISSGMLVLNYVLTNPGQNSKLLVIIVAVSLVSAIALNTVALGWGDAILFVLFAGIFFVYWVRLKRK